MYSIKYKVDDGIVVKQEIDESVYEKIRNEEDFCNGKIFENVEYLEEEELDEYKGSNLWTPERTKLLIALRVRKEKEFAEGTQRKSTLWKIIAREMADINPAYSALTNAHLTTKWKNLQVTYKRNKDRQKQVGDCKITWEYFDELEALNSSRPQNMQKSSRGAKQLSSNTNLNCETSEDEDMDMDEEHLDKEYSMFEASNEAFEKQQDNTTKYDILTRELLDIYLKDRRKENQLQRDHELHLWEEQKRLETYKIQQITAGLNNIAKSFSERNITKMGLKTKNRKRL